MSFAGRDAKQALPSTALRRDRVPPLLGADIYVIVSVCTRWLAHIRIYVLSSGREGHESQTSRATARQEALLPEGHARLPRAGTAGSRLDRTALPTPDPASRRRRPGTTAVPGAAGLPAIEAARTTTRGLEATAREQIPAAIVAGAAASYQAYSGGAAVSGLRPLATRRQAHCHRRPRCRPARGGGGLYGQPGPRAVRAGSQVPGRGGMTSAGLQGRRQQRRRVRRGPFHEGKGQRPRLHGPRYRSRAWVRGRGLYRAPGSDEKPADNRTGPSRRGGTPAGKEGSMTILDATIRPFEVHVPDETWPTFSSASRPRPGPARKSSPIGRRACSWRRSRPWLPTGAPATTGAGARRS
jgi:hypothetical protein